MKDCKLFTLYYCTEFIFKKLNTLQAYALGLFTKPFCISDLLSSDVAHTHPFILRERERSEHCPVERLRTISEVADGDAFVVNVASGFEIVDVDTSVIYYSTDCDGE